MAPDETELKRVVAIIDSMTPQERRNARILNGSRRKRIAAGSGTTVQDVNRLMKNFQQAEAMIQRMTKGGMRGMGRNLPFFNRKHLPCCLEDRRWSRRVGYLWNEAVADGKVAKLPMKSRRIGSWR